MLLATDEYSDFIHAPLVVGSGGSTDALREVLAQAVVRPDCLGDTLTRGANTSQARQVSSNTHELHFKDACRPANKDAYWEVADFQGD